MKVQTERGAQPVRCNFYVRTPAEDGKFHYDQISVKGPAGGSGSLLTFLPPAVGDRIPLSDEFQKVPSGIFRVLERAWLYPAYGSQAWPLGSPDSGFPLHLDLIVEACEGPFQNESDLPSPYRRI